jgi:hypothetical protein
LAGKRQNQRLFVTGTLLVLEQVVLPTDLRKWPIPCQQAYWRNYLNCSYGDHAYSRFSTPAYPGADPYILVGEKRAFLGNVQEISHLRKINPHPMREMAKQNIEALAPYARKGIPIIGTEPSCILTLRDEYADLLPDDPDIAALGANSFMIDEFLAKLDKERAEDWRDGEPRDASDYAALLKDIANLHEIDPAWVSAHADWIYSDDHRWNRERARRTLPAMVGLESAPEPADSGNESLSNYAARCNARAEDLGSELRLHEIAIDGEARVLVAATPAAFASLVKGGFLAVD